MRSRQQPAASRVGHGSRLFIQNEMQSTLVAYPRKKAEFQHRGASQTRSTKCGEVLAGKRRNGEPEGRRNPAGDAAISACYRFE